MRKVICQNCKNAFVQDGMKTDVGIIFQCQACNHWWEVKEEDLNEDIEKQEEHGW